jgi:UDP:flavonoid glycosyltransferase YjiC (YdhE family)
MGARFLMATLDYGGSIPPVLSIAAELVRRGHQVRILADPTAEGAARAAGCEFSPWQAAPHFSTQAEQTAMIKENESGSLLRQFRVGRDLLMFGPAGDFADDLLRTVRDHPVDAVLAESTLPGILVGALATGLPTAALVVNIYMRPTPGIPLFGSGWRPARGPLGRARDAVATATLRRIWAGSMPGLNQTLDRLGSPPVEELFDLMDRCQRVLVLTSPSFDFPASALPDNVRYVGPQLDDPHWASTAARPQDGDRPLVLVAASSIYQNHQADMLRRVAAALARLPVQAVLTSGRGVDPSEIPAPENVRVMSSAPHQALMREASVVVASSGHGTVLKALAAGAPLVCLTLGRDQKDNAQRVVRLGAGVWLNGRRASETDIAAAVRQVLEQPGYRQAAQHFARTLAREAAERPSAADEAEKLLEAVPSAPGAGGADGAD